MSKISNPSGSIVLKRAESLAEYVELVRELNVQERECVWFRGQGSAAHRLEPTVLRNTTPLRDSRGRALLGNEILCSSGNSVTGLNPERMLASFKRRSLPFVTAMPKNDFEWMFLMQHHGLPTRLLDWTTNALVGLFFAINKALAPDARGQGDDALEQEVDEFAEHSAAVFAFNPDKMNQTLHDVRGIIDVVDGDDDWSEYARPMEAGLSAYAPICIHSTHISPRIRAQSGLFTLHGSNVQALDYYVATRPLFTKIIIPYQAAVIMKEQLHQLGITESFIFPDLDGIAREILQEEVRRHAYERDDFRAEAKARGDA